MHGSSLPDSDSALVWQLPQNQDSQSINPKKKVLGYWLFGRRGVLFCC